MRTNLLIAVSLLTVVSLSVILPALAVDTLVAQDFQLESWSKIVDYFDYSRAFATLHGLQGPPLDNHAYVYMTYVNTHGMQMLYAGLSNITLGQNKYLTIPMQTFLMHYKSENGSDVLTDSNFLMLLAFNDASGSLYPGSPDRNDDLWSSFSMGFNYTEKFPNTKFPSQSTEAEIFPLTNSSDGLQWSWGMRYANLTATWWRTWISPDNHTYDSWPAALATYDELMFNYTLTLSPETHTATLTENHVIGRFIDLWTFGGWFTFPFYNHYNGTGLYSYGNKLSDETVYDFLRNNQIKMSIVDFQTSVVFNRTTYSTTTFGQNATDSEQDVSNASISTYCDGGEKILDTSFGTKETYKLYNYTRDPTETLFDTYNSTTRTCKIDNFAQNANLFVFHVGFMKFLPWLVYDMHTPLFDKVKDTIENMTRADYFFVTAYPVYGGYRIEHDPTYTAYTSLEPIPEFPAIVILPLFIVMTFFTVFYARKAKPSKKSISQN